MIQGTLRIIFDLLALPQTNRGYFWDEEAFDGKRICDLFYDCLTDSMPPIEQFQVDGDLNAIDLEDEEEDEVQMGPVRPPAPVLLSTKDELLIGPSIPKEILEMMQHDIPVQIEEDGEDVGPALPGQEERKPTEQPFLQSQPEQPTPKRLKRDEWMTMMPDAGFSSAFAEVRSRRFANIDPSWAETPEERKKKLREYLAKTQVGGVEEEISSSNQSNDDKQKRVKEYLEEYDQQYRPESLASIYKRVSIHSNSNL
ncbi:hypothetical protein JH06_3225 [Blastocystis sp. subtype 4]|uniref:hypothetical protein n=1 Tax=Blastocystis sp. subtype 4 TaxID=944170 RepID=UPI00071142B7|nr:hypothetical protein JH06_3225 [Blastocystis sp. subtype 4]KNB42954.1 hypothetical protein JH06_3225 [Blastocystis sp. subtype 4]|eukprot:XP_014526397.1 hypothetical protein JH06_3225 [Blastocystis sp. subtype 4]